MARNFVFRMYADVLFNRPIELGKDYISPGGYEMVMNGKIVTFDFEDYEGCIDRDNPCVLQFVQKNPDYETFEDLSSITEDDLKNVEEIIEFYIYTGEPGESDLEPVMVKKLGFEIIPQIDTGIVQFYDEIVDIECDKVVPYMFPIT